MPLSDDRRAGLNETKLLALASDRAPGTPSWRSSSAASAMAIVDDALFVYLAEPTRRDLGAVLVRMASKQLERATLFIDDAPDALAVAGSLARRAGYCAISIDVQVVSGRDASAAPPSPHEPSPPVSPAANALRSMLVDADLDVIEEHGVIKGEVLGLEVARIVDDTSAVASARVEVGIGRFDREIAQMMHGEFVTVDHVVAAADLVRSHRYPGAPIHPLRDLMPERWLRSVLRSEPSIVECDRVTVLDSTIAPQNLRDRLVAMAVGERPDGEDVCIGVTAGVDLDALVEAADSRSRAGMTGPFIVAVTSGDLLASVRAAADVLVDPPSFVTIDAPWKPVQGV